VFTLILEDQTLIASVNKISDSGIKDKITEK